MINQISNPKDRENIKKMLREISDSYTRIAAERDLIKETISEMSKQYELPKSTLNKMARTFYKQNFHKHLQDNEEFETLYKTVVEVHTP